MTSRSNRAVKGGGYAKKLSGPYLTVAILPTIENVRYKVVTSVNEQTKW
jgi:hypothetical protein